jgi:proton-translocating NADH-quinone oxidoreductase chain L
MKGDRDYPKFFVYLNLFVASMLILVLANNLLFTFVGWEGVGLCSYWLVSFWFGRDSAASAGQKAFLYNRLADVGFLIAMFLVFDKTGTLNYTGDLQPGLSHISSGARTAICLLLFVAAVGKSAQIPLFPWLADAMEGPTPVSALIHAATMVTAGVYLMCRISPLLALAPDARMVVASVGAATAFVAATIACAQQDIKKVLAYSTVSQLGYMFLAVGTGAYEAAIFLMVAHAFFKALLFLGAGSVIHGLHDEQDLKKDGEPAALHEAHLLHLRDGLAGHRRDPAAVGLLRQGRHPRQRLRPLSGAVGGGPRHRRPDRLLHDAARGSGLLRRRPVAPRRPVPDHGAEGGGRAARVAVGDGTAVGGVGGAGVSWGDCSICPGI